MWHVYYLCRHRCVGHAYLVFLLLLKQVEIEALLHLLVALHCQQSLCLVGTRHHLFLHVGIISLHCSNLYLQRLEIVAHRCYDVLAYLVELFFLAYDYWVLGGCAFEAVLQFQQQCIVLGNLLACLAARKSCV